MRNSVLKPGEEEQLLAYLDNPEDHAKDNIFIRDHNTASIVPFIYNDSQKILHAVAESQLEAFGLVRIILLKARRFGGSTYVQGRYYTKTSMLDNRNAFIVGHERESTNTLFEMAKLMQERNPMAPAVLRNNEKALKFDNPEGTGLKSEYRLASAENVDAGRSQGIHYGHGSEEAFWRDGRTLLTGLLQCLPDPPAVSEFFRESTANGFGNSFQEDCFKAYGEGEQVYYSAELGKVAQHMPDVKAVYPFAWRNAGQDWVLVFIPWFMHHRYQRVFDKPEQREAFAAKLADKVYDPIDLKWVESEAAKLRRKYGITLEQLHWREWAIENKCNGSLDKFHQEYPATVEEAFLSTGTNVYPKELCDQLEDGCEEPMVIGDLVERAGKVRIRRNKHGKFRIWERPDEDESYFVCVDSGGGKNERQKKEKKDPDPTCIEVWNHRTGAQAAQWHGHIAYDLIADVVELAGRLFGRATACVELQNHGYTVVADLKRKSYPMYQWKPDEPGWSTNTKTKPLMVDDLYRMSRDGLVHIRNKATVSEMRTFIEENGKYNSASGCHDERVDTAGMATQMMSLMPSALSQESASVFWNNIEKRSTNRDFQEVYTHH